MLITLHFFFNKLEVRPESNVLKCETAGRPPRSCTVTYSNEVTDRTVKAEPHFRWRSSHPCPHAPATIKQKWACVLVVLPPPAAGSVSLFARDFMSSLMQFTLKGPRTFVVRELWMIYFNGVNELQRKELAEKLVKPFTRHTKLCRRACLRFLSLSCLSLWFRLRGFHSVSHLHT